MSRTIVHDAIKLLTPSGQVRSRRGSGIFVGAAIDPANTMLLKLTTSVPRQREQCSPPPP